MKVIIHLNYADYAFHVKPENLVAFLEIMNTGSRLEYNYEKRRYQYASPESKLESEIKIMVDDDSILVSPTITTEDMQEAVKSETKSE